MEKQCKYTETYDPVTDSLHIVNEDGCDWENGVGYAPDNSFCGECTLICAEFCAHRTLIKQLLQEENPDIKACIEYWFRNVKEQ